MKYPEINLMGDGMRVKIITDDVEVYVYSENGKLTIAHIDLSPLEYQADESTITKIVKKLVIQR